MSIIAYEMKYFADSVESNSIDCIRFDLKYFQQYMQIYNECFYQMRKALNVQPYNFLSDFEQIADKAKDIYLLVNQDEIVGSVACYGNEIDDLIVNKKFRHKGYGKQLLLWAMQLVRNRSNKPITLHVAKWNSNALELYQIVGFEITDVLQIG